MNIYVTCKTLGAKGEVFYFNGGLRRFCVPEFL